MEISKVRKYRIRDDIGFYTPTSLLDFVDEERFYEEVTFPDEAIDEAIESVREDEQDLETEDAEEQARIDLKEALAYWLVFYEPDVENVKVALKCSLVPFEFKDTFFLALGACGMDLSPELDAYQVLTSGTIDKHSKLFSDEEYFSYVVGTEVTNEVKLKLRDFD